MVIFRSICDWLELISDSMESTKLLCDRMDEETGRCGWMRLYCDQTETPKLLVAEFSYTELFVTQREHKNFVWRNGITLWPNGNTQAICDWME